MTEMNLVASLKTAYELVHSLLKERDARIVNEKVVELTAIIMAAQQSALAANAAQFTLTERIRELEAELVKLKTWNAEKEGYKLAPWKKGIAAYVAKESVSPAEEIHAFCANCSDNGKKSLLQFTNLMGLQAVKCSTCGGHW